MPILRKTEAVRPMSGGEWSSQRSLLTCTLQMAVPLWIEQLRGRPWEYIQDRAQTCSQVIAEHGENLLFRSKRKGDSAEAFNRLAEGLACLAFCPGGVLVFGLHWEACLNEDVPARSRDTLHKLCSVICAALGPAGSGGG